MPAEEVQDIRILQQRSGSTFQYCVENLEEAEVTEEESFEQEVEEYMPEQTQVRMWKLFYL